MFKTRFNNYPKSPMWQSFFHDLSVMLFSTPTVTLLFQRKADALEFTSRLVKFAAYYHIIHDIFSNPFTGMFTPYVFLGCYLL
ncbi:hypothetical protein YC2023_064736 [Brassica napus]